MDLVTEKTILDALRDVIDPEVGINVVDLGLVYGVEIDGKDARVRMTMTTPACPLGPYIGETAETAIRARLPEGGEVSIELGWDPPWTPERISAEGRRQLGWE